MNRINMENSFNGENKPKDGFAKPINETELAEGNMRAVRVKGKPILLARVGGQIYAVSNLCLMQAANFKAASSQGNTEKTL